MTFETQTVLYNQFFQLKSLGQLRDTFLAFGDKKSQFVTILFLLQTAYLFDLRFRNMLHIIEIWRKIK